MAFNRTSSKEKLIELGANFADKKSAIEAVGKLLSDAGCVEQGYITSMFGREKIANTWLGAGVAIPHGMVEDRALVKSDAVAVLQVPSGVDWGNGEIAYLIFGIAAKGDGHLNTLRQLTRLLQKSDVLEHVKKTNNKNDIIDAVFQCDNSQSPLTEQHSSVLSAGDFDACDEWVVDYPNGLHARPASAWIELAKSLNATFKVCNGNSICEMNSLVALLELNAKAGDKLVFLACDARGKAAAQHDLEIFLKFVKELTASEKLAAEKSLLKQLDQVSDHWQPPSKKVPLLGVGASPGLALGTVFKLSHANITVADTPVNLVEGSSILQNALETTRMQITALADDVTDRLGRSNGKIFLAQSELLNDESLITATCRYMLAGHGVAWSWWQAINDAVKRLQLSSNALLAARSADVLDIGRQVLKQIDPTIVFPSLSDLPPKGIILLTDDLSPLDTANLIPGQVVALATSLGGPTSHMAILARTLGLPAVVAAGPKLLEVENGQPIIIDGNAGHIWLAPDENDQKAAQEKIIILEKEYEKQKLARSLAAITVDNYRFDIGANVNHPEQVAFALSHGAEGVGLMRTEFLFLERGDTPDEDEQYITYRAMLDALGDKPLIVRTLDIGGDKQVDHLNLPHEKNPFLGVRGARLLLRRPELLYPQLRALYRAAKAGGNVSIMFPMIMSLDEVVALRQHAEEIRRVIDAPKIPLGIMIEVPAAAIMADMLAEYVDFFSIGTNDLTQYTFAVDRQNPDLAACTDSLHPALLRMVYMTVKGAQKYNRWVGACGSLAGDAYGATLLAGLGVKEFSMTPRDIPAVKARLRAESFETMQKRAFKALKLKTTQEVRALDLKIT